MDSQLPTFESTSDSFDNNLRFDFGQDFAGVERFQPSTTEARHWVVMCQLAAGTGGTSLNGHEPGPISCGRVLAGYNGDIRLILIFEALLMV